MTKWNKARIIEELQDLHSKWANSSKSRDFGYALLRNESPSLISAVDSKRFFLSLPEALAASGIDPNCHTSKVSYGASLSERKATFTRVISELEKALGSGMLNDSSMNCDRRVPLPKALRVGGEFPECRRHKCSICQIPLRSIYAQGRRLFGDWRNAIEASGINYATTVLRKVAARDRHHYIDMLMQFMRQHPNWSISQLRETDLSTYKGLYNSHTKSIFAEIIPDDIMLCSYVEAQFCLRGRPSAPKTFCESHLQELRNEFYDRVVQQTIWVGTRKRNGGQDKSRIAMELLRRFGEGKRITRGYLEGSSN